MQERKLNPKERTTAHPRILLTDTNRWPLGARLAIAFHRQACEIGVLCRTPGHPAEKVSSVARVFNFSGYTPTKSLTRAIEEFDPDLLVPCCDRSIQIIHQLHGSTRGSNSRIAELIERSLGAPESFPVTSSRFALLKLAQSEGILAPKLAAVERKSDLEPWKARCALPWVMKADVTWGGQGIRFANDTAEAKRFLLAQSRRAGAGELIKKLILDRDWGWIMYEWRHSRRPVIAQSTINGRPANCAVVCWRGKILAGVAVEVIKSQGATGPATLVRIVEGCEMISAAQRIAAHLGISGFFGLDFVIEEGTGAAYLIEMNPRCTPPCSLDLNGGRNLVAALCGQLTGQPVSESQSAIQESVIAYFPRVEESAGTLEGTDRDEPVHDDAPLEEPDLLYEMLHPRQERTVIGRLVDRARRGPKKANNPIVIFKDAGIHPNKSVLKNIVRAHRSNGNQNRNIAQRLPNDSLTQEENVS